MDKKAEGQGLIPSFMEITGGNKPITGGLTRAAILGGLGLATGQVTGGIRDLQSEDPDSDYAANARRNLGLTGLSAGLLTMVPGLIKNLQLGAGVGHPLKYLNLDPRKHEDPEFLKEYVKGMPDLNWEQRTLMSHGRNLNKWMQEFSADERAMAMELAQLKLLRDKASKGGFWTPPKITASDYAPYDDKRFARIKPLVDQLASYARVYNKQPYGLQQYVRSQVRGGIPKIAAAINPLEPERFTGILDLGKLTSFVPDSRYGHGFPVHYTKGQIMGDDNLGPSQKAELITMMDNASGGRPGLITSQDIARAAVGAGVGYVSGKLLGKTLDGIFGGLTPKTHKRLVQGGVVAGLLLNTGAITR